MKGQDLREALLSSGKFYASDAALFIEDMVKTGRIEQTEYDVYQRKTVQATAAEGAS